MRRFVLNLSTLLWHHSQYRRLRLRLQQIRYSGSKEHVVHREFHVPKTTKTEITQVRIPCAVLLGLHY